jgi:hypothetical protein
MKSRETAGGTGHFRKTSSNSEEGLMSENKKTNVDTNAREFGRGVEAGLNSEDTKYWQAGFELGQEYSDRETKEPVKEIIQKEAGTPLFLVDTLDAHKGSAQDEKDKSAE